MYTTEFTEVPLRDFLTCVQSLKHQGIRFVQMCGETTAAGVDLLYTFYDETCDKAINLNIYGVDDSVEVPSIQGLYFAAFSYENETHDLFGVKFRRDDRFERFGEKLLAQPPVRNRVTVETKGFFLRFESAAEDFFPKMRILSVVLAQAIKLPRKREPATVFLNPVVLFVLVMHVYVRLVR